MTMATTKAASAAALIARVIFAAVFAVAAINKYANPKATADFITGAGIPLGALLAWVAAIYETLLVACLLSGIYFRTAALAAAAYVLFLGLEFHGPTHWAHNQVEFGFFVDHFTFLAGLLLAACYGPGTIWAYQGRARRDPRKRAIP